MSEKSDKQKDHQKQVTGASGNKIKKPKIDKEALSLACVTAASPRKTSEERRLCLTVDNRVRGNVTFPGMCGK